MFLAMPPNHHKTFRSSAFQEQIECYVQNLRCCEGRSKLLSPRQHTWGMLNQLYNGGNCGLLLRYLDGADHNLDIRPLGKETMEICSENVLRTCFYVKLIVEGRFLCMFVQ